MFNTKPFLDYVTERQAIYLRRANGEPQPWTQDPVLASKKFCCVIRDDDWTSREARKLIMGVKNDAMELGLCLGFRLYNRPSTLQALLHAQSWSAESIRGTLESLEMVFNTNAYRVTVKGGLWNIPSIALLLARGIKQATQGWNPRKEAQYTVQMIQGMLGVGPFLAYQIMQDLRWCGHRFADENTWCLIGGGALRGLQRLDGTHNPDGQKRRDGRFEHNTISDKEQGPLLKKYMPLMTELLNQSREREPRVNMFEVEHNLCEFDKHQRTVLGETLGLAWKPRS